MGKSGLAAFLIILSIPMAAAPDPVRADGPYKGKVMDAETQKPIEGAVVVAYWTREVFLLIRTSTFFVDAKETLTDKNGEFELPGISKKTIGDSRFGLQQPRILIFKPQYVLYPGRHVKPEGNWSSHFKPYSVVELPPLTTEKDCLDNLTLSSLSTLVPREKVPLWKEAWNRERSGLGLNPTK